MKTKTYEVELEDGRLFDVDVDTPSTALEHAQNFIFGGFTGIGGEARFRDIPEITEDVFMGHPVFGSAQMSAINDYAVNLLDTAASSVDIWAQGGFDKTPLIGDYNFLSRTLADKMNVAEPIIKYAQGLSNEIRANFSQYKELNDGLVGNLVYDVVQGQMSLLTSLGVSALSGGAGTGIAASMFGMIQKADSWNKAIAKGKTPEEARKLSDITMMTEAGLEFIGLNVWNNALKGTRTFARTILRIADEALQEAAQTAASTGAEMIFGVEDMTGSEYLKEIAYSGFLGALTGAPAASVHTSLENKGIIGHMRRAGFTEKQINRVVEKVHSTANANLVSVMGEIFPEETAKILNRDTNVVEGYNVQPIEDYTKVSNIKDVVVQKEDVAEGAEYAMEGEIKVTDQVESEENYRIVEEYLNRKIEINEGEKVSEESTKQDVALPEIVAELSQITEKINKLNSENKQVPDSLQKRYDAIYQAIFGMQVEDSGIPLTKQQVKELTQQPEQKEYTEKQALRLAMKRIAYNTKQAVKNTKKELSDIKNEALEYLKLFKGEEALSFMGDIANVDTREGLDKLVTKIANKMEKLYKADKENVFKESIKKLTSRNNDKAKYSESQALRISLGRMQTATREAFRAGKKDIAAIKSEIIEAAKLLPSTSVKKFLTAIDKAKTENDVNVALERMAKEEDRVFKDHAIKYLEKTIDKFVDSPSVPVRVRETIRNISDMLDFAKITDEKRNKLKELLDNAQERIALGEDVGLSRELYNALLRLNATYIGDLHPSQIEAITRDIEILAQAGREGIKYTQALRDMFVQEASEQLAATVKPIVKKELTERTKDETTIATIAKDNLGKVYNFLQSYDIVTQPMPFFFDRLDGGMDYNGPHHRYIYKPVNEKFSQYLVLRELFMQEALDLIEKNRYTKEQMNKIGLYAISQQENGKEIIDAMVADKRITQKYADDSMSLNEQEMSFYNSMRTALDKVFPYIKNTMADVYNRDVKYAKNYFTFSVDFSQLNNVDIADMFAPGFLSSPSKNYIPPFSKERKGAKLPLKINAMDIFTNYMDRASYLVTVGTIIPQISDMVKSDVYAKSAGSYTQKLVSDWISTLARKGADQTSIANPFTHKVLSKLRSSTATMVMGYKITSSLIQPTAIFNAAAYLGNYAFDGLNEVMEENSRRFILAVMPKLKNRIGDDVSFYEFNQSVVGEYGMYVLKHLDGITAAATALGAMKKYAVENGTTLYQLESEMLDKAVEYAESIVTLSQSSPFFIDAAPIVTQHGILGKMFSQFQSFSYTAYNSIRHHAVRYGIKDEDYGLFANMLLMAIIAILAPYVLHKGYSATLNTVMDYDDKRDENFIVDIFSEIAGSVPVVSPLMSFTQYGSIPVPSISILSKMGRIMAMKNSGKKFARVAAYFLGFFGAPSVQIDDFLRRI